MNLILLGFFGSFSSFGSLECRTENISFISVLKKPEPKFITVPSVRLVRFWFSVISVRFLGSGSFCPGLTVTAFAIAQLHCGGHLHDVVGLPAETMSADLELLTSGFDVAANFMLGVMSVEEIICDLP